MKKPVSRLETTGVLLSLCALCAGLVVLVAGCPLIEPTPECAVAADCDDGLYCNGAETCVDGSCVSGTSPCDAGVTCDEDTDTCEVAGCQSDEDCEDDEFCDVMTGECVVNENLYALIALDRNADGGNFDEVHPLHTMCTACHHTEPAAGFQSCRNCHSDDPNGVNSFKDVAHDQNESGDGCASCHAAEFADNCAFCHILLNGQ
ncbi:MAG: cytochrome c3 family protein [Phycisphaerae bacterium]